MQHKWSAGHNPCLLNITRTSPFRIQSCNFSTTQILILKPQSPIITVALEAPPVSTIASTAASTTHSHGIARVNKIWLYLVHASVNRTLHIFCVVSSVCFQFWSASTSKLAASGVLANGGLSISARELLTRGEGVPRPVVCPQGMDHDFGDANDPHVINVHDFLVLGEARSDI